MLPIFGEGTSIQNEKSVIREYFKSPLALFVQQLRTCYANSIDGLASYKYLSHTLDSFVFFFPLALQSHDEMKCRKVVLNFLAKFQTNKKKLIKCHLL